MTTFNIAINYNWTNYKERGLCVLISAAECDHIFSEWRSNLDKLLIIIFVVTRNKKKISS